MPPQVQAQPQAPGIPELLADLSPQQFQAWRHHPVTHLLLGRFLPDFRASRLQETTNAWIDGNLKLQDEQVLRGQILGCHFVENLSLEQIRAFYGVEPEPEA